MAKLIPCGWCGQLFRSVRPSHLHCSKDCYAAATYTANKKPVPVELACPYNEQLVCAMHTCSKCGWNPEVSKARLEAILAKMKGVSK